jgi:phage baseplate assembly protein W
MKYNIQNINYNNESTKGIGINIPFNGNTGLNITYNTKDATRANILNFLLTGTRERVLNPNFGSGIRDQIFEQLSQNNLENIKDIIFNNINIYFPQILLEELKIIPDNNTIIIYFKYSIKNTNIQDDIQISFNNE